MHRAQLVRAPAVAGTFYPADPGELLALVQRLLAAADAGAPETAQATGGPSQPGPPPKAIVAPHAGYAYSGPTAAAVYRTLRLRAAEITRVVLLGPAHYVPVAGLATPSHAFVAFETPLGRIPLDRAALDRARALPRVVESDAAHTLEHSLEVQLPFLQEVLGVFTLVPLCVGDATDAEVAAVLEALWGGPETLVVISTDLSHGHDLATARRLDRATCAAVEALLPERLGVGSACGRAPLAGLLRLARARGCAVRTLDLRTSGDLVDVGDAATSRGRVVGYGAWALA